MALALFRKSMSMIRSSSSGDREVPLLLVHDAREDDVQQGGLAERAERRVVVGLEAVGAAPEPQHAHQHVVVVEQPVEELPRRRPRRRAVPGGRAGGPSARGRSRVISLEVLDGQEHALQERVDLVLDPPQPVLLLDPLDAEVAEELLAAVLVRTADRHDPLPLPAHA